MKKKRFNEGLLITGKKEKIAFEEGQKRIKRKHHIDNENVVVVEKTNTIKFLVKAAGNTVHVIAAVILIGLAIVGLAALLYPEPRSELFTILSETIKQIRDFLGR